MKKTVREVLIAEYQRVHKKNPRYSVRQFAKKLGVDHSLLNGFFKGQRKISDKLQRQLLANVFPHQPYALFYPSGSSTASVLRFPNEDLGLFFDYQTAVVSECLHLSRPPTTVDQIAKITGYSLATIVRIIDFLLKYELIRRSSESWVHTGNHIQVIDLKIYSKARINIFASAFSEVEQKKSSGAAIHNAVTLIAADPSSLVKITAEVNEHQNRIVEKIGHLSKSKRTIYQLMTTFVPLTQE